jgi:O-antigen/teichoic acid export membrane protein
MPEGVDQWTKHRARVHLLALSVPLSVRRDYAGTIAVQGLTIGTGLLLFHMVARRASVDGFAYYQVARSLLAALNPVAMIGLVFGLQRYLPRAGVCAGSLARQVFAVQLTTVAVIALAGFVLAEKLGRLLGIGGGVSAVQAIMVALAGTCLWSIAVAALRGSGQVAFANVASIFGLGVVPLVAFLLVRRMDGFLALQGAGMSAVAVWGMAMTGRNRTTHAEQVEVRPTPTLKTLVRYGIRRTPGDIALPALFAFPTFFVAGATRGGSEAGYVGFMTSAVTLICAVFGTLTPVLLPRLSSHVGRPVVASSLWNGLRALPIAAVGLATLATVTALLLAPLLVRGFLGDEFSGAARILRLGLLASIPLAAYYAARPTLDALQDSPVTVKLMLGCFALEVMVTYLGSRLVAPTLAAVLGFWSAAGALGVLSYLALLRAIRTAKAKVA